MEHNAPHGGNKWKNIFTAAVILLLIANLWSTTQLRHTMQEMNNRVDNLRSQLSNQSSDLSATLDFGLTRMQENIEAGASLLSQTDTALFVEKGELRVSVAVTPKSIAPEEAVYVLFRGGDQELTVDATEKSGRYAAEALLSPCDSVSLTVLLLQADGTLRQEALEPLDVNSLLSFDCQSEWASDYSPEGSEGTLVAMLWGKDGIPQSFFASPAQVQFAIENDEGQELARIDLADARGSGLLERMGYAAEGWENMAAYYGDLSPYLAQNGRYNIYFELEAENAAYRVLCAEFQREENGRTFYSGNWNSVAPLWQ